MPVLAASHPDVVGQLSRLAFVPTLAGPLLPANKLYDPRVTGLRDLLDPQTAFPAPPFDSDNEVLPFPNPLQCLRGRFCPRCLSFLLILPPHSTPIVRCHFKCQTSWHCESRCVSRTVRMLSSVLFCLASWES